jgi:hypothetical protein
VIIIFDKKKKNQWENAFRENFGSWRIGKTRKTIDIKKKLRV